MKLNFKHTALSEAKSLAVSKYGPKPPCPWIDKAKVADTPENRKAYIDWHTQQYGDFEDETNGNEFCYVTLRQYKTQEFNGILCGNNGFSSRFPYINGNTNANGNGLIVSLFDQQSAKDDQWARVITFKSSAEAKAWWDRAKAEGEPMVASADNPWKTSKLLVRAFDNASGKYVLNAAKRYATGAGLIPVASEFGECQMTETKPLVTSIANGKVRKKNPNKGKVKDPNELRDWEKLAALANSPRGASIRHTMLSRMMLDYLSCWDFYDHKLDIDDFDAKMQPACDDVRNTIKNQYGIIIAWGTTETWYVLMLMLAKIMQDSELSAYAKKKLEEKYGAKNTEQTLVNANKQLDIGRIRLTVVEQVKSIMKSQGEAGWYDILSGLKQRAK